jgi:GNAT superfamily N-acetyltransferase
MADVLPPLGRAVRLTKEHDITTFDCGKTALNDYLTKYALQNQAGGAARTYVALRDTNRVVAYYSLAPAAVQVEDAPGRIVKGQSRHPVPTILMARFAIDSGEQGRGLGKAMLYDAMQRALDGAEAIGGRAFLVHAKDEEAKDFYLKFGMEPSPINPLHLFLLFKDIRQSFGFSQ